MREHVSAAKAAFKDELAAAFDFAPEHDGGQDTPSRTLCIVMTSG